MKSLFALAIVALGLALNGVAAQAAISDLPGYPDWAQRAFENKY